MLSTPQIRNIEFNRKKNIKFADATKRFNFASNSVDIIYSSHMFEHLSRDSAKNFIKESHRVLRKGGILRIVVPDLKKRVDDYLLKKDADAFLEGTLLAAPSLETFISKIQFFLLDIDIINGCMMVNIFKNYSAKMDFIIALNNLQDRQ